MISKVPDLSPIGNEATAMSYAELVVRAQITSGMLKMGEPIAFGSDAAIIDQLCAAIETVERERDEAFAANERDRSIVSEVRTSFKAALARRSWLLDGRGSYEWDDDRWKDEFSEAIHELGKAIDPLDKIGIDWSLCPTNPDEIAAARIDWKARAQAAERERDELKAEVERLREALRAMAYLHLEDDGTLRARHEATFAAREALKDTSP